MGGAAPNDEFGLLGTLIADKYCVESVVAAGGFGVVYRGRHELLGNELAIKVLKVPERLGDAARAEFVQMFLAEARIVAHLKHPAVVRALDFGVVRTPYDVTAPWMALEWIEGVTLGHELESRRGGGGRAPREVLAVLRPVIDALAEAHERGVVHRDVKPGNVMIPHETTGTSPGSRASRARGVGTRLLDFGIAKVVEGDDGATSGNTRTSSALPAFSPRYASPEQVSGMRTGPWTDVHALGLIFTEMLVDRAPFEYVDKIQLTAQVMSAARPTPARFGVDVGRWEPVLARAVALHPNDRYANAGELLAALESCDEEERAHTTPRSDGPSGAFAVEPVIAQTAPMAGPSGHTISALVPTETSAPARERRTSAHGVALLSIAFVLAVLAGMTATYKLGGSPATRVTPRMAATSPPGSPAILLDRDDASVSREQLGAALASARQVLAPSPVVGRTRPRDRDSTRRPRTTPPRPQARPATRASPTGPSLELRPPPE